MGGKLKAHRKRQAIAGIVPPATVDFSWPTIPPFDVADWVGRGDNELVLIDTFKREASPDQVDEAIRSGWTSDDFMVFCGAMWLGLVTGHNRSTALKYSVGVVGGAEPFELAEQCARQWAQARGAGEEE